MTMIINIFITDVVVGSYLDGSSIAMDSKNVPIPWRDPLVLLHLRFPFVLS